MPNAIMPVLAQYFVISLCFTVYIVCVCVCGRRMLIDFSKGLHFSDSLIIVSAIIQ